VKVEENVEIFRQMKTKWWLEIWIRDVKPEKGRKLGQRLRVVC